MSGKFTWDAEGHFLPKHITVVRVCLLCTLSYAACHLHFVLALWVVAQQADSPSHVCCGLRGFVGGEVPVGS